MNFLFRPFILFYKMLKGDSRYDNTNTDIEGINQTVDVLKEVTEYKRGLIRFEGTSYQALSLYGDTLKKGEKAKIVSRDGILYYIEKI